METSCFSSTYFRTAHSWGPSAAAPYGCRQKTSPPPRKRSVTARHEKLPVRSSSKERCNREALVHGGQPSTDAAATQNPSVLSDGPEEDSHACRVRTSKQADDVGGFRCPTTPKFSPNERAQRLMAGKITKSGHSGSPSPLSLDVLVTPVAPTHVYTLSCINLPDERKPCSAPSIAAAIHGRWS